MYQHLYCRFLQANQGKQHFACHSHHYWPDVTRDAMLQYWDDTARLVDDKWDYIFGEKMPAVQRRIATILNTQQSEQIVFAPNTHELLYRILTCLDLTKPNKILCTDSEFHSFSRQINRLNELDNIELVVVPSLPIVDFEQRFIAEIQNSDFELIFFSQVFFNSGLANPGFVQIVEAVENNDTIIVIDGYHGFMALPTDLSEIKDRVFYLAGSYKYAQGGEGCCFAHVPKACLLRPQYTGWFAEFGALDKAKSGEVSYSTDGMRFAGSTMDFSPLYRLDAVLSLFEQQGIKVADSHSYVQSLQRQFLQKLDACQHGQLNRQHLLVHDLNYHGHFLTFKVDSAEQASELAGYMKSHGILVDRRADRIRFGFAIYHNAQQYDLSCLATV
jgi:selenocysteine lyase/cysteine desulfurase